ncbi:MAG: acetyltransferase [Bryobacteraceae bacterium]
MTAGLIGYGALGRQVANLLGLAPDDYAVFDDLARGAGMEPPRAFGFSEYRAAEFASLDFYVCLGYKHRQRKLEILEELEAMGRRTPAFVHPSCFVNRTAEIGPGCILYPMCNIDQNVRLERGVTLHNSVVVSHDSRVGAGSYVSPGAVLCGDTRVGARCFLGARTVVSNGVAIGDDSTVGIGTVVTRNLDSGSNAIGSPMRLLTRQLRLE